jgi:hypothetical protein
MAAFAGFVAMMLVGYTVTDVGGWQAVGLVALVLVPVALLCLLASWRPALAVPVLAVATLAPVAWGVMQLLDYERWSAWEDRHGPISLVLVVAVGAALAVLGLSRPTEAGVMMLTVVLAPVLLEVLGAGSEWPRPLSIALVFFPVLVSGSLFVVAGRAGGAGDGRHTASRPSQLAH